MQKKLYFIGKRFSNEIIRAYNEPCYADIFDLGAQEFFSDIQEMEIDNTKLIMILTPSIERVREQMKQGEFSLYTLDGSNFVKNGVNEYISETPATIINEEPISYEDLLKKVQVFYVDTSKITLQDMIKLADYRKRIIDNSLSIEDMLNEEIMVNENRIQDINSIESTNYGKSIRLNDDSDLFYDILVHADEIDYDCIQVQDVPEPTIKKFKSKSGKRVDVIQCNEIDEDSVITNGVPSYQSIEMMIAVNGRANSQKGEQLLKKARTDYPPQYMSKYYYHFSQLVCLLAQEKQAYPYNLRKHLLLRMIRDFYPKAEQLEAINEYAEIAENKGETEYLTSEEENLYNILQNQSKEDNKFGEGAIDRICQVFSKKLKGKIEINFSNELINKLERFGVGKILTKDLKAKLLSIDNSISITESSQLNSQNAQKKVSPQDIMKMGMQIAEREPGILADRVEKNGTTIRRKLDKESQEYSK